MRGAEGVIPISSEELCDLIDVLALGPPSDEGQTLRVHLKSSLPAAPGILAGDFFRFLDGVYRGPLVIILAGPDIPAESDGVEYVAFIAGNGGIGVGLYIDRFAAEVHIYDPMPAERPTLLDRYFLYLRGEQQEKRQGPDQPLF